MRTTHRNRPEDVERQEANKDKTTKFVKKMQSRIVKAHQENETEKVRILTWLLTHSFYAKSEAVRKVERGKGSKTAGVDGILWKTPKERFDAVLALDPERYDPQPYKRIYIPKSNGKERPLSIPTLFDRAMQNLLLLALEPISECTAEPMSFGFRRLRRAQDAVSECVSTLSENPNMEWILEADIEGCFDNINHEWLIKNIPVENNLLEKILKCGYTDEREQPKAVFAIPAGVSQGAPLSPVFCNMTLDGLGETISAAWKNAKMIRYADDFVIIADNPKALEQIIPAVEIFLSERGLSLSKEKTFLSHISKGFDFLGFQIAKIENRIASRPCTDRIKKIFDKIRDIANANCKSTPEALIKKLNPVVLGWSNYYRFITERNVFAYMDRKIGDILWKRILCDEPQTSERQLFEKYFTKTTCGYRFSCEKRNASEESAQKQMYLAAMSEQAHVDYKTIEDAANPFSKEWDLYFEERKGELSLSNKKESRRLDGIYYRQKGLCALCGKPVTKETGYAVHEMQRPTRRFIVHPACHRAFHAKP